MDARDPRCNGRVLGVVDRAPLYGRAGGRDRRSAGRCGVGIPVEAQPRREGTSSGSRHLLRSVRRRRCGPDRSHRALSGWRKRRVHHLEPARAVALSRRRRLSIRVFAGNSFLDAPGLPAAAARCGCGRLRIARPRKQSGAGGRRGVVHRLLRRHRRCRRSSRKALVGGPGDGHDAGAGHARRDRAGRSAAGGIHGGGDRDSDRQGAW